MTKAALHKPVYVLLFMLAFFTSCNGQAAPGLQKDTALHPKLIKTQGSNEYANIHCGLQDKAGNLWLGTTGEGIYRYDGKRFTQFTKQDGLSSNTVWSVLEDKAGNIWIGTDAGLCRYSGSAITSIPISVAGSSYFPAGAAPPNSSFAKNAVWSILQDKKGTLWFGTGEGVYCYDGVVFTRFLDNKSIINQEGLQLKMVDCMLEDRAGTIWLASGMPPGMEGICRFDGTSITSFKPGGDGWVRYLLEDKTGNIWIGCRSRGVWRYDGKEFTRFMKEGEDIGLAALQDKSGNLWFSGGEADDGYGGRGGIWRYDGKTLTNFTAKEGLGDYSVWCMVADSAGNVWVGTRNTGLYRYDGKTFTSFSE